MTTFYEAWRTNGFRVRDLDAFKAWVALWPGVQLRLANGLAYLFADAKYGALPTSRKNPEQPDGDEVEAEFLTELGTHVSPSSVVIYQSVGFDDDLTDVGGYVCAIRGGDQPYAERMIDFALEDLVKEATKRFSLRVNHWSQPA